MADSVIARVGQVRVKVTNSVVSHSRTDSEARPRSRSGRRRIDVVIPSGVKVIYPPWTQVPTGSSLYSTP